jgi:hypothetical protein
MIFSEALTTVKLGLKIIVNELREGDLELFQNITSTMTLSFNRQIYQHLKAKTTLVSYSSLLCDHTTNNVELRHNTASCDTTCTASCILH